MMHFVALFCSWAFLLGSSVLAAQKGVPQELYDRLFLYSRYSACAYDSKTSKGPNSASVLKYINVAATHTQGVLFKDEKKKELILAFRGTMSLQDFQYDGMWNLVPFKLSGCEDCKAHEGYFKQWNSAVSKTKEALEQARASNPGYKIIVTGHSMGAGIAALAAPQLLDMGINTTLYTYGQPRSGNQPYADWVDKKLAPVYRVTYKDDGIAQIPMPGKGYRHHKTEYWANDPPSAANVWVCEGQEDKACNVGKPGGSIMGSHIGYFGKSIGNPVVSGCTGKGTINFSLKHLTEQ